MKVFSLFLLACILCGTYTQAQFSRCVNPNQRNGRCMPINSCQSLYAVLQQRNLRESVKNFLRESSCGIGYDNMPLVCCTSDTDYTGSRQLTGFFDGYENPAEFNAFTPPNEYFEYEPEEFRPTRTILFPASDFDGGNGWNFNQHATNNPRVNRPRNVGFNGNSGDRRSNGNFENDNGASAANNALIPQPPSCGGITISNKIYGGENADLYEFPWMVLMEYRRRSGSISTNCAGSLISQRYVLTAAHCVTGKIEREIGQLISVRLGEFDTSRKIDCNGASCAEEAIRVGIDEIRPHELYKEKSPNQVHDIALVRLERNIRYSASIRPICLPTVVAAEEKRAGQQYTVAGWGRTLQSSRSPIKQKLNVAYVEPEQCRRKFSERKISIVPTQLCAGGKYAQDSCDGDSGGPLMRFRGGAWVLEGIVSFGFKCGLKDWPGVYTNIAAYDDWIRRTVKA